MLKIVLKALWNAVGFILGLLCAVLAATGQCRR